MLSVGWCYFTSSVLSQLNDMVESAFCAVQFEAGQPRQASLKHVVSPNAVHAAFQRLVKNNVLYSDALLPCPDDECSCESDLMNDFDLAAVESLEEISMIPVDYNINSRESSLVQPLCYVFLSPRPHQYNQYFPGCFQRAF